jgi:hypothetical protein
MAQQPEFSLAQLAADLLVSIVGSLGALVVAYVIYQASRADQGKRDAALQTAEAEKARLQQENDEKQERFNTFQMLVGLMTELHQNQRILGRVNDGTLPASVKLHDTVLRAYYPTFGRWGEGSGETLMDAYTAVRAYNQAPIPPPAGASAEFENMFGAAAGANWHRLLFDVRVALHNAEQAVIDVLKSEEFMTPKWTGVTIEEADDELVEAEDKAP